MLTRPLPVLYIQIVQLNMDSRLSFVGVTFVNSLTDGNDDLVHDGVQVHLHSPLLVVARSLLGTMLHYVHSQCIGLFDMPLGPLSVDHRCSQ